MGKVCGMTQTEILAKIRRAAEACGNTVDTRPDPTDPTRIQFRVRIPEVKA